MSQQLYATSFAHSKQKVEDCQEHQSRREPSQVQQHGCHHIEEQQHQQQQHRQQQQQQDLSRVMEQLRKIIQHQQPKHLAAASASQTMALAHQDLTSHHYQQQQQQQGKQQEADSMGITHGSSSMGQRLLWFQGILEGVAGEVGVEVGGVAVGGGEVRRGLGGGAVLCLITL